MRTRTLDQKFCPYCENEAGAIGAGDETIDWCFECDVSIEGLTVRPIAVVSHGFGNNIRQSIHCPTCGQSLKLEQLEQERQCMADQLWTEEDIERDIEEWGNASTNTR